MKRLPPRSQDIDALLDAWISAQHEDTETPTLSAAQYAYISELRIKRKTLLDRADRITDTVRIISEKLEQEKLASQNIQRNNDILKQAIFALVRSQTMMRFKYFPQMSSDASSPDVDLSRISSQVTKTESSLAFGPSSSHFRAPFPPSWRPSLAETLARFPKEERMPATSSEHSDRGVCGVAADVADSNGSRNEVLLSSTASASPAGSVNEGNIEQARGQGCGRVAARALREVRPGIVTLIIRNIPSRYTAERLEAEWSNTGSYDYLYVPMTEGNTKYSQGCAFMNFRSHEEAVGFQRTWHGEKLKEHGRTKRLDITEASVQGLHANLKRFKGRLQKGLSDDRLFPLLYDVDGVRVNIRDVL
mmetsp:Transcript_89649/g.192113  ORF Transcript_89649/g.192113 Transcript_89649/m.192113 type:complete len:362 (-) Transcript_89649:155-1240(-)